MSAESFALFFTFCTSRINQRVTRFYAKNFVFLARSNLHISKIFCTFALKITGYIQSIYRVQYDRLRYR